MLYFAFGSNLYQKQMKKRCKDSKYIGCHKLKGYKLIFRHMYYGGGVADVEKKKNSKVLGQSRVDRWSTFWERVH